MKNYGKLSDPSVQRAIKEDLVSSRVRADYGNSQMIKIDDIDFTKNPSHTFKIINRDN